MQKLISKFQISIAICIMIFSNGVLHNTMSVSHNRTFHRHSCIILTHDEIIRMIGCTCKKNNGGKV